VWDINVQATNLKMSNKSFQKRNQRKREKVRKGQGEKEEKPTKGNKKSPVDNKVFSVVFVPNFR